MKVSISPRACGCRVRRLMLLGRNVLEFFGNGAAMAFTLL